ncbi:MAG: Gfo/Idh/MocA family protein, partial [Pirellulaceae bacterium]
LLDRRDIDAVLIATGDRWHADASMLAAKAGKHVYSEKPCGISVELCQRLSKTMEETGRVFQAGTQRRSVPNFQQAVEWVHSGRIGKLKKMHA